MWPQEEKLLSKKRLYHKYHLLEGLEAFFRTNKKMFFFRKKYKSILLQMQK